jgi:proteasome component ECM29
MTQDEDDQVVRSARFATVRWANRCLEYSDVVGRWIDILAVGGRPDERSDVMEEGNKGLVRPIRFMDTSRILLRRRIKVAS